MTAPDLPLVTIGIATYNRADSFLPEALESARAQTYPHLEIIVADNGSTDGTEELVRKTADPRVRYYRHEKNIGPIPNFNFCLERARGRYFLLLHDDDRLDPDMVACCIDAIGAGGEVGIVLTGARIVDGEGRTLSERPNRLEAADAAGLILGWVRGRVSLFLCSTLFHTGRLKALGGFQSPRNLLLDVAATLKLGAISRADVPGVKASFRRHGGNHGSAARIRDWAEDSLFVLDTMCELAPEHATVIRREGTEKLCRHNYIRAQRVPGRLDRWLAFWTNYRTFGYRHSPWAFVWRRQHRRFARRYRRLHEPAAG
jgi:glycosyltransferase involved in cell wall biosynthesis